MSDRRLRDLQRRLREGGGEASEGDLLREAVRLGVIAERKLQIASDLGYAPARRALELEPFDPAELPALARLLRERWGQWELVQFARLLAHEALPQDPDPPWAVAVRATLAALDAWLEHPGSEPRREVTRAWRQVDRIEVAAWAGEDSADLFERTSWTVTRPPMRGVERDPVYAIPALAYELLGAGGYERALRAWAERHLRIE